MKVATILGTRPEIIRLSCVIKLLEKHTDHVLIHTGQNWDHGLNQVFFDDLNLRKPDHFLDAGGGTLGETLGAILIGAEKALIAERPDAVLILGDTNSAIAALMARRLKIPIYHMEAGNRCFDLNVPEETNRRIVDHIADFNLVYSEHARRHLLAEGLSHRRIYHTGSPMAEVLAKHAPRINASPILSQLKLDPQGYMIASLHREENVDPLARLTQLMHSMNKVVETHKLPLILSTHPRTAKRLAALDIALHPLIRSAEPFGFFDYNHLQMHSFCAISDSGTIAEESAILDFAAITPRDAIERPEALDTGTIIQTGLDADTMLAAINAITNMPRAPKPSDYAVQNTAQRVLNLILGTAKLSNDWGGIRG